MSRGTLPASLFHRLMDDDPAAPDPAQHAGHDRGRFWTLEQYKEEIRTGLESLLSTYPAETSPEMAGRFPLMSRSVVNYGFRSHLGKTLSGVNLADVEMNIREAIERFEPRLVPGPALRIQATAGGRQPESVLQVRVDGLLAGPDAQWPVALVTYLDLEAGVARVLEAPDGGAA